MNPTDCSNKSAIIQVIGQTISFFTVIGGWFVVHWLTKKREKRKEVFEKVESFCIYLCDLEKKARNFHLSPSFDGNSAEEISLEIQRTIAKLNFYPLSLLKIDNKFFINLRQSITLKNFVKSEFHQIDYFHPILKEISLAIDDLINRLQEEFIKKFGK